MAKVKLTYGQNLHTSSPKRFERTSASRELVSMAVGSGMRLNSAMSILLVALLILGGMASMSSLEMSDASATGGNQDSDEIAKGDMKESNKEWLDKCNNQGHENLDYMKDDWADFSERSRSDILNSYRLGPKSDGAEGRDSGEENNTEDSSDEIDWHLPDHITVIRTDFGYTISIIDDEVTITENYTDEEFALFLERFGWESESEDDRVREEGERDREEIRERVGELRESCSNGDDDSCRELRGLMERFRHNQGEDNRDRDHREDKPVVRLERLDDGTIIAHREFSDGSHEYDIISTADNGEITLVRVTSWGTQVIHPQSQGGMDKKANSDSFHDFSAKMGEEDFRAKCHELLGGETSPKMDLDFDKLERVPTEQKSERR